MDIIILANFCTDFSDGDNGRFSYLANILSKTNEVEIITSDFYHSAKKYRRIVPKSSYIVTFIHEPGYKKNVSIKRFFSHYVWGNNVEKYLNARKKPDVVYCAVPSLTGPNKVAQYCEKNNIRFVIDIQDLWPEAFRMILNLPLIYTPFNKIANKIYARADAICAVSDTYVQRALKVNQKCKAGMTVFLGTELETFDKYAARTPIKKKSVGEFWIAYCGTLGSSYDLNCVVDALSLLEKKKEKVKLIVMGDGPKKEQFMQYALNKGVNALFFGQLPYDQMCSLLCECDITVNPIVHRAAQSIINKHADYAASGLPVVSTQENKEYRDLVELYDMGFNCKNNDPVDLAKKIKLLIDNPQLCSTLGANARRCAEEKFDRKISYKNLCNVILQQ